MSKQSLHRSRGSHHRLNPSVQCPPQVVHRFPNPPPTGFGIFWYSFDYATVHVIMLSSEHDLTPDSAQYRWFEKDLAQIDRKAHPWVVVTTHRPAYCSQSEIQDYAVATHIADQIDGLLMKWKVNLFLAGHYHSYPRDGIFGKNGDRGLPTCRAIKSVSSTGSAHLITQCLNLVRSYLRKKRTNC